MHAPLLAGPSHSAGSSLSDCSSSGSCSRPAWARVGASVFIYPKGGGVYIYRYGKISCLDEKGASVVFDEDQGEELDAALEMLGKQRSRSVFFDWNEIRDFRALNDALHGRQ